MTRGLRGGAYEPIELEHYGNGNKRGYSEALGLYVCWEGERLRLYDPVSDGYLRTHAESAAWRWYLEDYADALADVAKARAAAKASGRLADAARVAYAEARAEAEAAARADAGALADAEAEAWRRRMR